MKMYVSTLNAEVDGHFVKITFSFILYGFRVAGRRQDCEAPELTSGK